MNLDSADQTLNLDAEAVTSGAEFSGADGKTVERSDRAAVLVLGMHRSGTSSVAGAMIRLGGAAPLNLLPPQLDNPRGFWESSVLVTLNDEILAAGGSHWEDWRQFDPKRIDAAAAFALKARARSTLAGEFGDASLPIVKDPRMCRLMPFWSSVFQEANWSVRAVLQLRSPLEVALSLNRRDAIPLGLGCLIWLRHVLDTEAETRGMRRAVVEWNDFLGDRRGALQRVGEQLDIIWPRWSDGAFADIDEFVSADLRRQRASDSDLEVHPAVNDLVREAYVAVRELVENPTSEKVAQTLTDIRERFDGAAGIFGHAMFELEEGGRRAQSTGMALRNEYVSQLTTTREEYARQISEASTQLAAARGDFARQLADARSEFARQISEASGELADARAEFARQISEASGELADARGEFAGQLAEAQDEFATRLVEARSECRHLVDEANRNVARAEDVVAYLGLHYELDSRSAPTTRFRDYLRARPKERKELTAILNSAFFDAEFYLNLNPDVRAAGMDATLHYLLHGGREGRDPGPFFSTQQYLVKFPDVAASGLNALAHYEMYGRREMRRVPLSLPPGARLNDVLSARDSKLSSVKAEWDAEIAHLNDALSARDLRLSSVKAERDAEIGRLNDALSARDVQLSAQIANVGESQSRWFGWRFFAGLIHFPRIWRLLRWPFTRIAFHKNGLPRRRLHQLLFHSDGQRARQNLLMSRHEIQSPNPLLDGAWYIATNPDVAAAGFDPLWHYVRYGSAEGRKPNPLFDPEWYLARYPDVAAAGIDPVQHFMQHGAAEGRDPCPVFQTRWYVQQYEDVAASGMNPLAHYLLFGRKEGREANSYRVDFSASKPVTATAIDCRKKPIMLRREVALFVSHSPKGGLKPHVRHYLESLAREGIGIILIVAADRGFADDEPWLYDLVDGLYVRANEGHDWACWAHVLALNSYLYRADILYWLNDSVIGPVNQEAFHALLERLRANPAALVGLTANHECGWHLQSYFLAFKRQALESLAFREFVLDVKCLPTRIDVINGYEIRFSRRLEEANIPTAALFELNTVRNPTLHDWKQLLEEGFAFLKIPLITNDIPDVDKDGWREALQRHGYDVTLADRLLAESATPATQSAVRAPGPAPSESFRQRDQSWVQPSERREFIGLGAIEPRGRIAVVVHVYYEDLWPEISRALDSIDEPFDLFVTLVAGESDGLVCAIMQSWPFAHVLIVENHGRDILPFLSVARTGILFRYEFVCKLHTKRSPWHEDGDTWRQNLIKGVLGDCHTVRCILRAFRTDPDLGLVVSDGQMFSGRVLWTGNEKHLMRLFQQFGMDEREFDRSFAGGSIFWIRSCLLRTISDLPVAFDDFEPEPIDNDGSLPHAIERVTSLICYEAGMVIMETSALLAASQTREKVGSAQDLRVHVART